MRQSRVSGWRVLAIPAGLAAAASAGLAASLVGDGGWDWLGTALLLAPAGVGLACLRPPRRPAPRTRTMTRALA